MLVPYIGGDNRLAIGPDGHYRGPLGMEEHIVKEGMVSPRLAVRVVEWKFEM